MAIVCTQVFGTIIDAETAFEKYADEKQKLELSMIAVEEYEDFYEEVLMNNEALFRIYPGVFCYNSRTFLNISDGKYTQQLYIEGFKGLEISGGKVKKIFTEMLRKTVEEKAPLFFIWDDELSQEEITDLEKIKDS